MAEEVNIGNVGGEGVASDVTLQRLIAVTQAMAKKAGVDPKDVNKKLVALSKATEDTVKVSTKNRDALGKNTKEIEKSTSAVKKFSRGLAGSIATAVGTLVGSVAGLTKTILIGEKRLSDFAKHMPIAGEHLGDLVGVLDDSIAAQKAMSMSGADFNYSITQMRMAAANSYMELDEFTSMVTLNSDKLSTLGGTVTQGAMQLTRLHKGLGDTRLELLNLGLTQTEVNESLLDYAHLTRAGSRQRVMDDRATAAQSQAAARYTKNLLALSKLSGQDVKDLKEKAAAAQQSLAFQMKLATLDEKQREKINANLAIVTSEGGQAAMELFQAEFLNMPPITEAAQQMVAINTEGSALVQQAVADGLNANLTVEQNAAKRAELITGLNQAQFNMAKNLETQLSVVGAGGEAGQLQMEALFADSGKKMTGYIDEVTGTFNTSAALIDAQTALAATNLTETGEKGKTVVDPVIEAANKFALAVGQIQIDLETKIFSPMIDASGEAVKALAEQVAKIPDTQFFKTTLDTAKTQIEGFGTYIDDFLLKLDKPGADPLALTKGAFFDGATAIMDGMKNLLLGKVIEDPGDPNRGGREGGLIRDLFAPAFSAAGTALVDGIKYLWEEHPGTLLAAGAAITALFALPALGTAMVTGIASMWALKSIGTAMSSGIGSMFSKVKPPVGSPTVGRDPKTGKFTSLKSAPGASNTGKVLGGLGKGASRLLGPLAALLSIAEIGMIATDDSLTRDEKTVGVSSAAGGGGGALAGAAAGAALGSVVPILGTAIGGLLGGALGYFGGSYLGGKAGEAIVGDGSTGPAVNSPGVQLAQILTEQQVGALERIGKVDLSDFNTSIGRLNISNISYLANVDFTTFASGLKTFAEISNLKTQFDTINSLDAMPVLNYTSAMEDLVEVLEKVNDELSKDNNGIFASGTGTNAGDMINSVGGINNGGGASSQQLNSTMNQVLAELRLIKGFEETTAKNTKNITSGNIAQSGVTN